MPGIPYPPNTVCTSPQFHGLVQNKLRTAAAYSQRTRSVKHSSIRFISTAELERWHGENANMTSNSVRVEKIQKLPGIKERVLTLRKLEVLPYSGSNIRAERWTESFDAVVVGGIKI